MQTMPLAPSDTPTLPGLLLPARSTARPASYAASREQRRSLVSRLLVDLGLLVRLAFLMAEGLLAVRVVLVLLGANANADFSSFVFGSTGPLLTPFADVFQGTQLLGGMAVDATAILAIVVYWVLARLVEAALRTLARL